jgi:hypothetical protein
MKRIIGRGINWQMRLAAAPPLTREQELDRIQHAPIHRHSQRAMPRPDWDNVQMDNRSKVRSINL